MNWSRFLLKEHSTILKIIQKLAGLNWIAVVLSPVAVSIMEAFWVYSWLVWIEQWPALTVHKAPLGPVSLLVILITAYIITRFITRRNWSLAWSRLTIISCGLLVIFLVIRFEYSDGFAIFNGQWFYHTGQVLLNSLSPPHPLAPALIFATLLWLRGVKLGRSPLYTSDIYLSFVIGIFGLVLLIIVWSATWGTISLIDLSSALIPNVAIFFFAGLAALAITNLYTVQRKIPPEETLLIFNRRWLPILFGIVGGIVLLGTGVASIFSPDFLALMSRLLTSARELVAKLVEYLLMPFGYTAEGIAWLVQQIGQQLRGDSQAGFGNGGGAFVQRELTEAGQGIHLSETAVLAIKWGLVAIAVIIAVFFLTRLITRYRSGRPEAEVEELNESLWSWQGFKSDLRLFFSMLLQRFRRKKKQPLQETVIPAWFTAEDVDETLNIREIYQRLLWVASRSGTPRRKYETPYEFKSRLGQTIPEGTDQLNELTGMYVDVRYGDYEAEEKQVDYANRLWKAIKQLFSKPESED